MLTGWPHKGCKDPKAIWRANQDKIRGILGQYEITKTGKLHWQCYVEFKKRIYGTAVSKVFKSGEWTSKPAKGSKEQSVVYCSKSDSKQPDPESKEEISYFEFGEFAVAGKSNKLTEIQGLVKGGTQERALWKSHFTTMVLHHRGIRRGIAMLSTPEDSGLFAQDKFPWTAQHPIDWTKTQIFWGESGIGKTQWALSLFKKPLLVSDIDQLGLFDNTYDGIIFDDCNFVGDNETKKGAWPVHKQIHLVDQDNVRAIRIRYEIAVIPAHTKKVITTNVGNGWVVSLDEHAISRRVEVHELKRFAF